MPNIQLINDDCMNVMQQYPDKHFDLAIVDPPYGINMSKGIEVGKWKRKIHKTKDWDNKIPNKEYFKELFRVSNNQIIWGGNYYIEYLKNTKCMIFWDKKNGDNFMSDGELAWTSFDKSVKRFIYNHIQEYNLNIDRIHPTQKPIALYKWLLTNYAKPGDKILDTHLGSGSIAIACHDYGFDLVGTELDGEYYAAALNRYNNHIAQQKLF